MVELDDHHVIVRVLSVKGSHVKLGFESSDPDRVIIYREESKKDPKDV